MQNRISSHPVEGLAVSYIDMLPKWQRLADVIAGRDAIIAGGDLYLPKLRSHINKPDEFREYQSRTPWHGGTGRSAAAFSGALWRKDGNAELPARLEHLIDNANNAGDSLKTVVKSLTSDMLTKGRAGLLADRAVDGSPPYLVEYRAEAIRNWRMGIFEGQQLLEQVVLHERASQPDSSGFGTATTDQYRVLELDEDGLYRIRIFQRINDSIEHVETIEPRPSGKRIPYVPFCFVNSTNLRAEPQKPPLSDLADAELWWYRLGADLAHGLHRTAFPTVVLTVVLTGVDGEDGTVWEIGNYAWMLPMGATFGMLEYRGDGLGSIERAMDRAERLMAHLGSSLLQDQKRVAETQEALRVRSSAEFASLADIARTASTAVTRALRWTAEWESVDPSKTKYELNQDFFDDRISPEELRELVGAVQSGFLPLDDFLWNLQQGEVLRPGKTVDQARDELAATDLMQFGTPARQAAK